MNFNLVDELRTGDMQKINSAHLKALADMENSLAMLKKIHEFLQRSDIIEESLVKPKDIRDIKMRYISFRKRYLEFKALKNDIGLKKNQTDYRHLWCPEQSVLASVYIVGIAEIISLALGICIDFSHLELKSNDSPIDQLQKEIVAELSNKIEGGSTPHP
jgi:hypothetical protein